MTTRLWLTMLCAAAAAVLVRQQMAPAVLLAHAEIDQITPSARATVVAKRSGHWSDANTWDGAQPGRSARVWIPKGIVVTIEQEVADPVEWVRVDGQLRFAPHVDTALNVETLAIEHDGRLEIGTAREPVTARATVTIEHRGGPIDHIADPLELSRGLIATGAVEMHGRPKTGWVAVSTLPQAGDVWLSLDRAPDGWAEGDALMLTATNFGESETFRILSLEGTQVRLDRPVTYSRQFPVDASTGQPYQGLSLHVGNLTRNVVVRTHPQHAGQPAQQGHVMLMHRGGHAIRYAAFEDLGRTTIDAVTDPLVGAGGMRDPSLCPPHFTAENVRGRYALHFHMASPFSEQSLVEGSVVTVQRGARLKIGYINHSSNVMFRGNVGVNIDGSTFFTEEGDEVGGFVDNLAIYSFGSNSTTDVQPAGQYGKECPSVYHRRRLDVGHKGHGFWIHGGGVEVAGNVAAEHAASGFNIWSRPLDFRLDNTFQVQFPTALLPGGGSWAKGHEAIGIEFVPFVFRDNTAYVLGHEKYGGIAAFEVNYHSLHQVTRFPGAPKNVFTGSLGWNVTRGIVTAYAGWTEYSRLRLIRGDLFGMAAERSNTVGLSLAHQGGNNNLLHDVKVEGFKTSIRPSTSTIYEYVVVDGAPYVPSEGDSGMEPGSSPSPQPEPRPRR